MIESKRTRNKSPKLFQKLKYQLLGVESSNNFNSIFHPTDHACGGFCSSGTSADWGQAVVVACSHILIVSLRDRPTDFMCQRHFHLSQAKGSIKKYALHYPFKRMS